MIRVKGTKYEYLVDVTVTDDETGSPITYKKSVWVKSVQEIQNEVDKQNAFIVQENTQHTIRISNANTSIDFWQGLLDEITNLE